MNDLKKELTELSCLAIKLSIKIMSKLIKYISTESTNEKGGIKIKCEEDYCIKEYMENSKLSAENCNSNCNFLDELLNKTKIFLKMTRLIIINAKYNADTNIGKSKEFFQMYLSAIFIFTY